jgi:type II secretory pathway pseudopilin PulG
VKRRQKTRRQEKGYVLLTLLLMIALLGIVALTAIIPIKFEIQRDQELEMIHRGVQYTRAIRAYYKKFNRYPTKLEDLDNTNNLRYLRKHYKDPLNKNHDFRLLHFGEPGVALGGGLSIGGGSIPGATPVGGQGLNGGLTGGLNGSAQSGSAFGGGNAGSILGNSGVNSSGVFAQTGANSNSSATSGQGTTPASGTDPTQASAQVDSGTAKSDTSSSSQQLVASGPIVGVASICKNNTIREFNKKKRYNEWQFLYDPSVDRGGLITTPYQPLLQTLMNAGQNNLQPGAAGGLSGSQSSFGQSSFGQSGQSGFGNNSTPGGSTTPAQPTTTSPQQP